MKRQLRKLHIALYFTWQNSSSTQLLVNVQCGPIDLSIGLGCGHKIMPRINEYKDTNKRYGLNPLGTFDYFRVRVKESTISCLPIILKAIMIIRMEGVTRLKVSFFKKGGSKVHRRM